MHKGFPLVLIEVVRLIQEVAPNVKVLEVVVLVEEGVVVDEVEAVGEAPLVHHLEGLVEVEDLARRTN